MGSPSESFGVRLARRGVAFFSLLLVVAVPLAFGTNLKDPFRAPKLWIFETLTLVVALSAVLLVSQLGNAWRPWRRGTALRALLPFLLAGILTWPVSVDRLTTTESLISLGLGTLLIVLWSEFEVHLERLLDFTVGLGCLFAIDVALQFLGGATDRYFILSVAGHTGDLAVFLVVPALWTQARLRSALFCSPKTGQRRWHLGSLRGVSLLSALVLVHAGLVISQSLSATLAITIGGCVLWFPRVWKPRTLARVGLFFLAISMVVWFSPLAGRVSEKLTTVREGNLNALTSGRLDGWRVAMRLYREYPLLGVGLGCYEREFNRSKEELLDEGVEFFEPLATRSSFGNAHNDALEVLAEMGTVGGLALAWTLFQIAGAARRRPVESTAEDPLASDFVRAAWLGIAVVSLTYFPTRLALTAVPIALVFAMTFRQQMVGTSEATRTRTLVGSAGWKLTAAVLMALCLAQAHRVQVAREVEILLQRVEVEAPLLAGQENPRAAAQLRGNLRDLEEAFDRRPFDERLALAIGSYQMLRARPEDAEGWYRRAIALELRPESLLYLSWSLEIQGRQAEAYELRSRVARLEPYRPILNPAFGEVPSLFRN